MLDDVDDDQANAEDGGDKFVAPLTFEQRMQRLRHIATTALANTAAQAAQARVGQMMLYMNKFLLHRIFETPITLAENKYCVCVCVKDTCSQSTRMCCHLFCCLFMSRGF